MEVVLEDKGDSTFRCIYRFVMEGFYIVYVVFVGVFIIRSFFFVYVVEGKGFLFIFIIIFVEVRT